MMNSIVCIMCSIIQSVNGLIPDHCYTVVTLNVRTDSLTDSPKQIV